MQSDLITRLKEYLESEEGKKSSEEYFGKIRMRQLMEDSQMERFHLKYNTSEKFSVIVEKIIAKYYSDEYTKKEYKCGRQPMESLFFFLYEYAGKYGRVAIDEECEKHGNMFTAGLYTIHDYFFNLMCGQGSVVQISKKGE